MEKIAVRIHEALQGVTRLFLDTAPVIYYVEKHPAYLDLVTPIFRHIDSEVLVAVTSPVTLAECLVMPCRLGLTKLQQDFTDLIVYGQSTIFAPIEHDVARMAAELRASYNVTLADALQIAVALRTGCEALLTNDGALERVKELRVLTVDDLKL